MPDPTSTMPARLARTLVVLRPVAGLLLVAAVFYTIAPGAPLSLLHVRTMALHTMIVGIGALGMTLVILAGMIDLSVGSGVALASVAVALASGNGWPLGVAILAGLATGIACGLYNGLLVTALRLPSFIATLGTLGFFRGVAKWISGSRPVSSPTRGLESVVHPVPNPPWLVLAPGVWLMLILAAFMAVRIRCTVFGRHATAIGSNEVCARGCGIGIASTRIRVFAVAGLFTGLAGVLQFARLTQGDPTVAVGLELDVIAAVVIGGASLSGGQASVAGTLAGAFMMAYLKNRCAVLGWPNYVQEMIVGHIIIAAVALDRWRVGRVTV